jgi:hypothetical protein
MKILNDVPARNAATRQLGLRLLDTHFLKVDELGTMWNELEVGPVGAHLVAADRRLRIFELLLHVTHYRLTLETQESAANQFRVDRMRAHYLACNLK